MFWALRSPAFMRSSHPQGEDSRCCGETCGCAAPITHGDILAQLTFGVFLRLLPAPDATDKHSRAREVLWSQALVKSFPRSRDDPKG